MKTVSKVAVLSMAMIMVSGVHAAQKGLGIKALNGFNIVTAHPAYKFGTLAALLTLSPNIWQNTKAGWYWVTTAGEAKAITAAQSAISAAADALAAMKEANDKELFAKEETRNAFRKLQDVANKVATRSPKLVKCEEKA